jgi:hypothetical protein
MTTENPIHIRLEYREALQSKKDILSYQMSLLRIAKTVKSYKDSRAREIELKLTLLRKMRELKVATGQLNKTLPKPKMPEILKGNYPETEHKSARVKSQLKEKGSNLEEQLSEIQRKLNQLQSRSV